MMNLLMRRVILAYIVGPILDYNTEKGIQIDKEIKQKSK